MKGQIANSFILAGRSQRLCHKYSTLLVKSKSSHRQSEMNEHVYAPIKLYLHRKQQPGFFLETTAYKVKVNRCLNSPSIANGNEGIP